MESVRACTLRGQLELVPTTKSIDISEVEPAVNIVKRFATGKIFNLFGKLQVFHISNVFRRNESWFDLY